MVIIQLYLRKQKWNRWYNNIGKISSVSVKALLLTPWWHPLSSDFRACDHSLTKCHLLTQCSRCHLNNSLLLLTQWLNSLSWIFRCHRVVCIVIFFRPLIQWDPCILDSLILIRSLQLTICPRLLESSLGSLILQRCSSQDHWDRCRVVEIEVKALFLKV